MLSKVEPVTIEPKIRDLDYVPRWSIVRRVHGQSVASHIYFVMRYAMDICRVMNMPVRQEFVWAILVHEDDELHSGDIPQPFKHKHGLQSQPNPDLLGIEQYVLKVADILESVLFLADELAMGNKTMINTFVHLKQRLYEKIGPREDVLKLCQETIASHLEYQGRIE